MTGTGNGLAVRDDRAPVSVPAGALAIEAGQTSWTTMQAAALGQLGIADAPEGDKQVFLHVSQRTGLDPFAKQIYMIGRKDKKSEKRGNQWVDVWSVKYSIQTGIEGFRVIRGRAERAEGIRGILSRPVFYNGEGQEFKVWFFKHPPVAVEMTYTVRDRNGNDTPYTSILRYDEYRQTRKDGEQLVSTGQWATKPVHMLEKCTEADVYRKAFPQDFSGVDLDDATPPAVDWDNMSDEELDQRARAVGYRPRVTTDQLRERATQPATAVVVTPDPSPAAPEPPRSGPAATPPAEVAAAGEAKTAGEYIGDRLAALGAENPVSAASRIAGRKLADLDELSAAEATTVMRSLRDCKTPADLDGLLAEIEMAGDPRGEVPGAE